MHLFLFYYLFKVSEHCLVVVGYVSNIQIQIFFYIQAFLLASVLFQKKAIETRGHLVMFRSLMQR